MPVVVAAVRCWLPRGPDPACPASPAPPWLPPPHCRPVSRLLCECGLWASGHRQRSQQQWGQVLPVWRTHPVQGRRRYAAGCAMLDRGGGGCDARGFSTQDSHVICLPFPCVFLRSLVRPRAIDVMQEATPCRYVHLGREAPHLHVLSPLLRDVAFVCL